MHDILKDYAARGAGSIGLAAMANLTAILGAKGTDAYQCQDNTGGSNVLSVAFAPSDLVLAAAWERDSGAAWRPAACSDYLTIDLKQWF